MPTDIAEDKAHEIEGIIVLGIQANRSFEGAQRLLVQPAMVQHFAEREMEERAFWIEGQRALQIVLRTLDRPRFLFGERQLQQRRNIVRRAGEQLAKLDGGVILLAE